MHPRSSKRLDVIIVQQDGAMVIVYRTLVNRNRILSLRMRTRRVRSFTRHTRKLEESDLIPEVHWGRNYSWLSFRRRHEWESARRTWLDGYNHSQRTSSERCAGVPLACYEKSKSKWHHHYNDHEIRVPRSSSHWNKMLNAIERITRPNSEPIRKEVEFGHAHFRIFSLVRQLTHLNSYWMDLHHAIWYEFHRLVLFWPDHFSTDYGNI